MKPIFSALFSRRNKELSQNRIFTKNSPKIEFWEEEKNRNEEYQLSEPDIEHNW